MAQTAVQWLIEQLTAIGQLQVPQGSNAVTSIIDEAKEMEKEQIMESFEAAEKYCGRDILHGDLYYNETFNPNQNETKTN